MPRSEQIDTFRRGLYPILVRGDVAAFLRYLAHWEDLFGDTLELSQTSEAEQRRTMAMLLRRPQQFNLPPWPKGAFLALINPGASALVPAMQSDPAPTHSPVAPASTHDEPMATGAERGGRTGSSYQLDMLTGELRPVPHRPSSQTAAEPGVAAARRPRRRARPLTSGRLTQLSLWSDDPAGALPPGQARHE